MIKEEYKNISDEEFVSLDSVIDSVFAGRYMINKLGWIKTISTGEIKKSYYTNIYPRVSFRSGSKIKKSYSIHILVAKMFLINDDPKTKIHIDHIDRDMTNFSVHNLRWVTVKENLKNRSETRRTSMVFRKYDSTGKFIEEIKYSELSVREVRIINSVIRGNYKYRGFIWERVDLDIEDYINRFGYPKDEDWRESIRVPGLFCNKNGLLKVNGKLTLGSKDLNGYRMINYKRTRYRIHRLIFETFNGKLLEDDEVVDHISCVTDDNRFVNLRVGTQRDNMMNINTIKKLGNPVVKFDLEGNKIKEYVSATAAARDSNIASKTDIVNACKGKSYSAGKCLWCFKGEEDTIPDKVLRYKNSRR